MTRADRWRGVRNGAISLGLWALLAAVTYVFAWFIGSLFVAVGDVLTGRI